MFSKTTQTSNTSKEALEEAALLLNNELIGFRKFNVTIKEVKFSSPDKKTGEQHLKFILDGTPDNIREYLKNLQEKYGVGSTSTPGKPKTPQKEGDNTFIIIPLEQLRDLTKQMGYNLKLTRHLQDKEEEKSFANRKGKGK